VLLKVLQYGRAEGRHLLIQTRSTGALGASPWSSGVWLLGLRASVGRNTLEKSCCEEASRATLPFGVTFELKLSSGIHLYHAVAASQPCSYLARGLTGSDPVPQTYPGLSSIRHRSTAPRVGLTLVLPLTSQPALRPVSPPDLPSSEDSRPNPAALPGLALAPIGEGTAQLLRFRAEPPAPSPQASLTAPSHRHLSGGKKRKS